MKKLFLFLVILHSYFGFSQVVEITNPDLIKYYEIINRAEISITNQDMKEASHLYREAFENNPQPLGKDLYNSMLVFLKIKNYPHAYKNYSKLKCLQFSFQKNFLENHFPIRFKNKKQRCQINLDYKLKKELDSLYVLDQKYRRLSKGDYAKVRTELTTTDSIASSNLASLIAEKGFPNEYDIGFGSAHAGFSQKFYVIILHQLANNIFSPQVINFSKQLNEALNQGKISPESASFLLDLNNGRNQFFSKHFAINGFVYSNGSNLSIWDQTEQGISIRDCCYVTYGFYPEKRTEELHSLVKQLNENRKKIGLCTIDESIKKSEFSLKNKDFFISENTQENHSFDDEKDAHFLRDHMFKIQ